ncbi:hypothetical protein RRG08_059541 [Elysia crispata]|uniref:Uncharacterized protein n=1 Tax=Elysia crispata TaxID=231223 RepID=A0AAE1A1L6_9GAST|nr:hypothetical protein RRG08_059541 [Elysia crispata]
MMVLVTTYQYLQHPICVVEQCVTRWIPLIFYNYDGEMITTYQYLQHPISAVEQCVARWSLDLRAMMVLIFTLVNTTAF